MRSRSNKHISKIKEVKGVGKKDETKAAPRTYETHEPAHDSLEKGSRGSHCQQQAFANQGRKVAEPAWAIISSPRGA